MITFNWYLFSELSLNQLYDVISLRSEVFVVEQNCAYQDLDGKDQQALHLLGTEGEQLCAYLRLFPPGKDDDVVFGRVITAPSARQKGYGKQLISKLLEYCEVHFPDHNIRCSAQYYLVAFYESFGFQAVGSVYQEDNIPHIKMIRKAV